MTASEFDSSRPELVFGIAAPIGVDIEAIRDSLTNALRMVHYESHLIHLTSKMMELQLRTFTVPDGRGTDFFSDVMFKMDYANALCKETRDPAALARIALRAITTRRAELAGATERLPPKSTAYIVRQFKRPDEVFLFRQVYGKQFILVSAYGSAERRKKLLEEYIRRSLPPSVPGHEISHKSERLIVRDAAEDADDFGQHLRDTFPLADVVIDGLSRREMEDKLTRFIQAFFGRTDISPSKDEYGMYTARAASLRSSDLSRQVGAAIFSEEGELITQGCNEVPRANGGTYWDLEEPDYRDVRLGYDPNDMLKKELLRDLFDRLSNAGLLSPEALALGAPGEMVEKLIRKRRNDNEEPDGPLANCDVMDLTEFGRVVHAEMNAICDAARLGRSVKNGILFCTTFPCHNCAKHIVAAGIKRVVYIEPYPKSRVKDLHQNEIQIEEVTHGKVSFMPFLGISPVRYRDIFQKGKRKTPDGKAMRWLHGTEKPMIDAVGLTYFELEMSEIGKLIGKFEADTAKGDVGSESTRQE